MKVVQVKIGEPVIKKLNEIRQKGRDLELHIERVLEEMTNHPLLKIIGIRIEVRQAKVAGKFVYCKRQPFDYLVIGQNRLWAFDAKECSSDVWYPSKAPQHQRDALTKVQDLGFEAGFVVYFKNAQLWPRWIEDFDSPATPDSGRQFGWEMFFK